MNDFDLNMGTLPPTVREIEAAQKAARLESEHFRLLKTVEQQAKAIEQLTAYVMRLEQRRSVETKSPHRSEG